MSEPHTTTAAPAPESGALPPPVKSAAAEAVDAYLAELDDLLAYLAAHPADRFVAYRRGRRIGFGRDRREFERECLEQFPDGQFRVMMIDGADKCPGDTVV